MTELDPKFTFENFVVGPANRLAAAAARRAAESPGSTYNPLFIYSASGLGKTHILGAVAHHVAKIHPDRKVGYVTLEDFLNALTEALEGGDRAAVRRRYEEFDVFLLDDVQFLTGQTEAQEMLLRALDALTAEERQVIITSDRPPSEIDGLDGRLRSRFEGGLLVDIAPPEFETRVAIVQRQAEARGQTLEPGVAEVVGRIGFRNVRELGGALNRILAVQELEERRVSAEEAAELLGEERGRSAGVAEDPELDQFLHEITDTVAQQVEAQEAPWRKLLREAAEKAEAEGFKADRLRRYMAQDSPPEDVDRVVEGFSSTLRRLKEIAALLDGLGNPWPEAAYGVLRDPERLEEAEALLASGQERVRPLPAVPPGPGLDALAGRVPPLVLRAAEQLVGTDRPEYNPLFLWSPDGIAARAVMEAAGRALGTGGDTRVAYLSAAQFSEDFVRALTAGVAGAWRERWWATDYLLIHGAQDFSRAERAQDEFFHLFEALQRRKARIMIAADRLPMEMKGIDDRLRSRFEGGLVLEIPVRAADLPEAFTVPPASEPRAGVRAAAGARGGAGAVPSGGAAAAKDAASKAAPAAAAAAAAAETGEAAGGDVVKQDLAWIRSLGKGGGSGAAVGPAPTRPIMDSTWHPSPERVVWNWPRLEERIVEEID